MRLRFAIVALTGLFALFVLQQTCRAQSVQPEPFADPDPAPSLKTDFWNGWKSLPGDLVRDQKQIWLFPLSVARGKNRKPTLMVIGATAGLVALDGYPARHFANTNSLGKFNKVFSGHNTARANILIPVALYGIGLARKDSYAQKTFVLAGEAVLNSEVVTSVMKDITHRQIPYRVLADGNGSNAWFREKFSENLIGGNGSFPSGHTITAFAVATVYAKRYSKHRWVSWLAYSLASLDGLSRMSLQSHFGSDVFVGGVLGFVIGRQAVQGAH